ncbi:hypothetical protein CPB83DRAFT_112227 [Crepidotus variabilis]|uniref:DUF6699 domain-containing protein n=1 Tax=Crepidotus variabilis TaxID=179855 RepID=A0A9P6E4P5_9AGAR|nr:hypothetical protein CPB83DRAFT_112227 [Crepidotus variabilis]
MNVLIDFLLYTVTYHPSNIYQTQHHPQPQPAVIPHQGYTCQVPPPHADYGSLWRPQQFGYSDTISSTSALSSSYGSNPIESGSYYQGRPSSRPYTPSRDHNPQSTYTRSRSDSTHSRHMASHSNSYYDPHPSAISPTPSVDPRSFPPRGSSHLRPPSWYQNEQDSFQGHRGYYNTQGDGFASTSSARDMSGSHLHHLQSRPQSSLSTHSRSRERSRSRNDTSRTTYPSRSSTTSPSTPFKLSDVLNARMKEYPSIDWALWDPMTQVNFFVGPGRYGNHDPIYRSIAFTGTVPVAESVYIEAAPGRLDSLYIAITRWGPIKVSPREQKALTICDIIEGIDDWMKIPLHPRDWGGFDKTFMNQIFASYERRKRHSTPIHPLPENPMEGARRVDTLFCQVIWDGLELAQDFSHTKRLYLRLKAFHHVRG